MRGISETKEEISKYILITAAPLVIFAVALFLYNLVRAPYLVYLSEYSTAQQRIQAAEQGRKGAEEAAASDIAKKDATIRELQIQLNAKPKAALRDRSVPVAGPQSDEAERENRRQLRIELGKLLQEGQSIQVDISNDPHLSYQDLLKRTELWAAKTEAKLNDLGSDYVARFGSSAGLLSFSPRKTPPEPNSKEKAELWSSLNNRLTRLNQFLEELR